MARRREGAGRSWYAKPLVEDIETSLGFWMKMLGLVLRESGILSASKASYPAGD
jgi:hypothetical protein